MRGVQKYGRQERKGEMGVRTRAEAGMRLAACVMAAVLGSLAALADPALAAGGEQVAETARVWDFSGGTQGWVYDGSWAGESYTGGGSCSWDEENGRLKVSLDYSGNTDNGWSQTGISFTESQGIDYAPYRVLSFDLYYDTGAFSTGQLTVKPYSGNIFTDQMSNMNQAPALDAGDGKKMVTLSMLCDTAVTKKENPRTLMLLLIGNNTDYRGDIWLDNIKLSNVREEKYLVDATVRPDTETRLSATEEELVVNGGAFPYPTEINLVDEDADAPVIALYRYLRAVGESDGVLYGHMEDTVLKAGAGELSESDTKDVTGSLSAVVGFDCGNLFSGFASRYNSRNPGADLPDTNAGNIEAAARFSNEAIREGAVITLSAHAPNFAGVPKKEGDFENSYDGFDFLATDSYNLTGNTANQILPGGQYHDRLTAYLDMVADYAKQVDGPILFRPWHENTGSWFWWGKAFCDAETYKSIYKYTVEYLRDEKQVHNLLYLYGPGSEASTLAEYEERYPGDSYVDLVGFDTYDSNPVPDEEGYSFLTTFEEVVKLTDTFAKQHGKLFAVTETGISSESGGIPETGNRRPDWYREILGIITKPEYDCCYFMLWSNYSRTGSYYTPFVQEVKADGTLFGHELMDSFLQMYNHKNSIFAADQKEIIGKFGRGMAGPAAIGRRTQTEGYIISPVAASRVLEPQLVTARLSRETEGIGIKVSGNGREYWLDTVIKGKEACAELDGETIAALGEAVDGRIALYSGEEKLQEIGVLFNIEPRPDNPFLVDDFESYGGVGSLLSGSWSINKDSGCKLTLSLVKDFAYDGQYALQFDYQETKNGWAGCELLKEADWSGCNALQFLVVPDGKNQKTVVQINTSAGGSYEAYLQTYPEYARAAKPLLVTIPFEEFQDKNGGGKLTEAAASSISGIGFWVNAIPDSEAVDADGYVSGTLIYDAVRAGYTDHREPTFEPVDFGDESDLDAGEIVEGVADVSGEGGGKTGRSRMVMVISGLVSAASLICLLWLALGLRKKR